MEQQTGKRYRLEQCEERVYHYSLIQSLEGNFVASDDYDAVVAEVQSLRAERDRLNKALLAWEDREAAVCPEDVGFEEVIQRIRAERDTLREALTELTGLARDVLVWLPDNLPSSELYAAVDNLAVKIPPLAPQTAEETQG